MLPPSVWRLPVKLDHGKLRDLRGNETTTFTACVAIMIASKIGRLRSAPVFPKTYEFVMRRISAALLVASVPLLAATTSPAVAQSEQAWGAIYFSQRDRAVGAAWNRATQSDAILKARKICRKYGRNCELATEFQTNECGAIADGPDGWAADFASSSSEAQSKALEQCSKDSSNCKIIGIACNNGIGTSWFKENENPRRTTETRDEDESSTTSLASQLQSELKRIGCLSGKVDGKWGPGSRRALAKFADEAGLRLDSEPTQKALDAAKSSGSGYCRAVTAPPPRTVTTPPRRKARTVRRRVRCSRVRFAYTRGRSCACAGGRVFTGSRCVYRRRRR